MTQATTVRKNKDLQAGGARASAQQRRGEARLLADLLLRGHPHPVRPQRLVTELPEAAIERANDLFERLGLPYGQNEAPMRAKLLRALERMDLEGCAAPKTELLHPLRLDDANAAEGYERFAYLDPPRRAFFLRITDATADTAWYGPFAF